MNFELRHGERSDIVVAPRKSEKEEEEEAATGPGEILRQPNA